MRPKCPWRCEGAATGTTVCDTVQTTAATRPGQRSQDLTAARRRCGLAGLPKRTRPKRPVAASFSVHVGCGCPRHHVYWRVRSVSRFVRNECAPSSCHFWIFLSVSLWWHTTCSVWLQCTVTDCGSVHSGVSALRINAWRIPSRSLCVGQSSGLLVCRSP